LSRIRLNSAKPFSRRPTSLRRCNRAGRGPARIGLRDCEPVVHPTRFPESRFLLFGDFVPQRAKPRIDDRQLVEIAVARLGRELELIDSAAKVALPGVELALMLVLQQLFVECCVRAGRNKM